MFYLLPALSRVVCDLRIYRFPFPFKMPSTRVPIQELRLELSLHGLLDLYSDLQKFATPEAR